MANLRRISEFMDGLYERHAGLMFKTVLAFDVPSMSPKQLPRTSCPPVCFRSCARRNC